MPDSCGHRRMLRRLAAFGALLSLAVSAGMAAAEPYIVWEEDARLYRGATLAELLQRGEVVEGVPHETNREWLSVVWHDLPYDARRDRFRARIQLETELQRESERLEHELNRNRDEITDLWQQRGQLTAREARLRDDLIVLRGKLREQQRRLAAAADQAFKPFQFRVHAAVAAKLQRAGAGGAPGKTRPPRAVNARRSPAR